VLCFLCGTDWIFKCYSDELLQRVKAKWNISCSRIKCKKSHNELVRTWSLIRISPSPQLLSQLEQPILWSNSDVCACSFFLSINSKCVVGLGRSSEHFWSFSVVHFIFFSKFTNIYSIHELALNFGSRFLLSSLCWKNTLHSPSFHVCVTEQGCAAADLKTCIQQVPSSYLWRGAGYPNWGFSWVSSVFSLWMPGYYLEIFHDSLLPNSYILTIHHHLPISFDVI
jgi:hypothetical protein